MNAEQLSQLQTAQALAAQRQQVAASTQAPPKLSVPLSLGTLFKCLRSSEDGFDFQSSAALTKAEGAASDLVRGLASVQGQGPLADAAASPSSLRNLGRLITAGSHDLKALCDTPPPAPPTTSPASQQVGADNSSSGSGAVEAPSVAAAERSEAEAEAAVKAEQVVMLGLAAIRLAALQSLVMLANSDARIAAMVEAGVPEVVVRDLLACPTANFDLNGLKAACDLARNLSVAARRQPLTRAAMLRANAVPALVTAAVAKARDQNAAVSAAAALRLLLEAGEHNATLGAKRAEEISETTASSSSSSSSSTAASVNEQPGTVAESLAPCVASILDVNLDTMHPFVRVELARTLALAIPLLAGGEPDNANISEANAASSADTGTSAQASTKKEASAAALALLSNRKGIEFVGFLLASRQPPLHAEAVAALSALRRAAQSSASATTTASATSLMPPQPPPSSSGDATSSSHASSSNDVEPAVVQTSVAVLDPMAVGAMVGSGDGTTDQSLAERLVAIRRSGSANGLTGPVRRRFEADLCCLIGVP